MMTFETAWQQIQTIRGWFSNQSQAKLMWDSLQNGGHAIEIGSYCGRSAVLLAYACQAAQREGRVYCIDTFSSDNEELDGADTYDEFLHNIAHHKVEDFVEVIRGRSDAPEVISGVPEDAALLYIDACHDYECVVNDIANWRMHVRKDGWMVGHDYYSDGSDQFRGVKQAFDEAYNARKLRNRKIIPGDSIAFQRPRCSCSGW